MTVAEIAAALGGAHRSGEWWRCRCPVHGSRGPTLALRNGERGLFIKCFAGCDPRDVLAELRRRGLLGGSDDRGLEPVNARSDNRDREDAARRIEAARRIWNAAQHAAGTPLMAYLAGRGFATITPPPSLRWAPRCWHRQVCVELPAMLARVDGPDGGFVGVHRTYLQHDAAGRWERRDRASLGPIAGGAVRLAPAAETLLIGEGIETCLAAMQATAQPAWAALSTAGLVALTLPPVSQEIVILADHDRSGAGERAAYIAADRWLAEGRQVRIAIPPTPGTDMADVHAGRAHARIMEVRDVGA